MTASLWTHSRSTCTISFLPLCSQCYELWRILRTEAPTFHKLSLCALHCQHLFVLDRAYPKRTIEKREKPSRVDTFRLNSFEWKFPHREGPRRERKDRTRHNFHFCLINLHFTWVKREATIKWGLMAKKTETFLIPFDANSISMWAEKFSSSQAGEGNEERNNAEPWMVQEECSQIFFRLFINFKLVEKLALCKAEKEKNFLLEDFNKKKIPCVDVLEWNEIMWLRCG